MIKSNLTGVLCAVALVFSSSTSASSINIDFGYLEGEPASVFGGVGEQGFWNQARLGTTSGLIDINDTVTGVSVDVIAQADGGSSAPQSPGDIDKLLGDNIFTNTTSGGLWEVQFGGLSDGAYEIIIYAPSNTAVSTGLMTINGVSAGELPGDNPASLIDGISYGIYNTIVSGGLLDISGTTTGSAFSHSGLAGVQISPSPVPLPAAVWLFGSGLLGLVGVAWRRKS